MQKNDGARRVGLIESVDPELAQGGKVHTYLEMNGQIVEILRMTDNPAMLYAAARIEELERQLAVMWGADEPHESGDECLSCERLTTQETWPYCRICLLTAQLEVCSDGFGEAHRWAKELEQQLEVERQARREAELELEAVLDKVEV